MLLESLRTEGGENLVMKRWKGLESSNKRCRAEFSREARAVSLVKMLTFELNYRRS